MPDQPDIQKKFEDPQSLYEAYKEKRVDLSEEERTQVLQDIGLRLDPYNNAVQLQKTLIDQERALAQQAAKRVQLEKDLDSILQKRSRSVFTGHAEKAFTKEMEALGIMRAEAEKLLKTTRERGIAEAKNLPIYERAVQAATSIETGATVSTSNRTGGVLGGAALGHKLGGARGAFLGGMAGSGAGAGQGGIGQFAMDLLNSLGPGGIHPAEVIKNRFPGMNPVLIKSLGGIAGLGGYVAAGQFAYNQLQSRIGDPLRSMELAGQQAGGGIGEGFHQRRRALQLGINPFDAITSQIAQEIVQGTMGAGFKGRQADQVESAAKSIYIKTGMSIQDILTLTTLGIRNMGLTIKETETEIKTFHDSVKDTSMSLQEYTQRVTGTATYLASEGQGPASLRTSQALNKALGPPYKAGQVEQLLQNQMIQAQLGLRLGVDPNIALALATPQQTERTVGAGFTEDRARGTAYAKAQLAAMGITNPSHEQLRHAEAAYMDKYGVYTQGLGVDAIEYTLRKNDRGESLGAEAKKQDVRDRYAEEYKKAIRGGVTFKPQDLEDANKRKFLDPNTRYMSDEEAAYYYRTGKRLSDLHAHGTTAGGKTYLDEAGERRFEAARRRSLADVASHTNITDKDLNMFKKHMYDPKFQWGQELENLHLRRTQGRRRGDTIDVPTRQGVVVIKLDKATKSLYLERDDKSIANNAGAGRSNDSPHYVTPKTAAENRAGYGG